jgi:tight adherence protein B
MGLIIGVVFFGVFAIIALLMIASGTEASQQAKQVNATLDSVLATDIAEKHDSLIDIRKIELLSGIPWLNRRLLKFEVAPRLHNLLHQAGLSWTAGGLLSGCGVCFAIPALLVNIRFHSVPLSLLVGLLLFPAPFIWVIVKRNKRFDLFQQGLPEALDLMVGGLRAGHSLIAAMGLVARECPDPVGSEFKTCFEEQNYGLELKTALHNMIIRIPLQELRIVSTAIMIQKESGGNLAEVLDKTAHVIRERFRLKRQVGVHTAQGRLTGWILTLLPVGLGVVLYISNPKTMSVLWTNPLGIKLLCASIVMLAIGGLIMRSIVNVDV